MEELGIVGSVYEPDFGEPGDDENILTPGRDCRNPEKKNMCKGTFEIMYDKYERPFLQ